ncbi:MAG TPA: helix-hairpin-helix domain-containing protein [Polyangia bacterium]|nr:helix-hairpin-helix domain-containing protein [Polyangia bacterium]
MSRRLSSLLAALAVSWLGFSARADAPVRAKPPASASATGRAEAEGVVNLNEASADELELLPGIGPAKARSIVEHRHAHPFRKAEDITKVKGIGRKTFGKLRPYLTLTGPTTLTEEPKKK